MTSQRGSGAPHGPRFTCLLRIQPALNPVERDHLRALADWPGTLRGTPTGRGDRDVPFARMAWEVCAGGCCLTWNPDREASELMVPTLRFLIDHLLRRGAKAEGHPRFAGFAFDHVVDGVVVDRASSGSQARLVEVTGNRVSERMLSGPCGPVAVAAPVRVTGRTRRGRLPANVIEFRPRQA